MKCTGAPGYGWDMDVIENARMSRPVKTAPRRGAPSADPAALLEMLIDAQPAATLARIRSLVTVSPRLRSTIADRLDDAIAADRQLDAEIDRVATDAARAQETFEKWAAERVDRLLADLAETFAESAGDLAEATVRETGLGHVADKALKNRFASTGIYQSMAAGGAAPDRTRPGGDRGVVDIASPVGVVFGIVPVTNPVATAIFKTLITLKGQNALVLSFHRSAFAVGQLTGAIVRDVLEAHGAPRHLVQVLGLRGSRKATTKLMGHPQISLILATGGAGLVKAAYSSGKPAIGVGPGNAPAWICADADIDRAAQSIVFSKTFDNGLICGAEHNLVVDDRIVDPFVQALERHGAAVLTPDEAHRFTSGAVEARSGMFRRDLVGRTAADIAAAVGIERPERPRLLIVRAGISDLETFYGREKLAPFLSLFAASGEDEGLQISRRILQAEGAGHTAVIHTTNAARVERFARAMPAGRILVNSPAAQGCCGMTTGLERSLTLGCGTFGGNSTTDNVTFRHLMNVKRVAHYLAPAPERR
jgi:acetaldehyde dehydrogenase/alcohol dehydrogenase